MNFYGVKRRQLNRYFKGSLLWINIFKYTILMLQILYIGFYIHGIHKYAQLKIIVITTEHTNIA